MKNYLIYLLAAVSCTTVADLKAQVSTKTGNETTELTIPKKFYKDSIDSATLRKDLQQVPSFQPEERRRMGSQQKSLQTSSKERN